LQRDDLAASLTVRPFGHSNLGITMIYGYTERLIRDSDDWFYLASSWRGRAKNILSAEEFLRGV